MVRRGCGTLIVLFLIFAIVGVLLVYLSSQQATDTRSSSSVTTTGSVRHAGPPSLYPNPVLTPGDALPGVTATQVCVPGYSTRVRSVTSAEKAEVFRRYNEPDVAGKYEVDH
ncbi:MAG TPA: hypothetical protein VIU62_09695, partial [Chloroflexota bacterium]